MVPAWQPMKVPAEADFLETGRAVLELPGGLRRVARHGAGEFEPPRRFVDDSR